MTPDRNDQTHDEAAEHAQNGVLSDTGSVESAGLGFLGGQTEQVSVVLPSNSDDDLVDDDVIDDEVALDALGYTEESAADEGDEVAQTGEIEVDGWTDAESVYDSSHVIEDASVVEESVEPGFEDAAVHEDSADAAEDAPVFARTSIAEIGRASCRERVFSSV